jgi:hypothetical protein
MIHPRLIALLHGATALAAIAALIVLLTLAPRFSNIERHVREVRQEVITLQLPPGVKARLQAAPRKEVMPEPPGHNPGGKPARANAPAPPTKCPSWSDSYSRSRGPLTGSRARIAHPP